jgi:hypothetical protein
MTSMIAATNLLPTDVLSKRTLENYPTGVNVMHNFFEHSISAGLDYESVLTWATIRSIVSADELKVLRR